MKVKVCSFVAEPPSSSREVERKKIEQKGIRLSEPQRRASFHVRFSYTPVYSILENARAFLPPSSSDTYVLSSFVCLFSAGEKKERTRTCVVSGRVITLVHGKWTFERLIEFSKGNSLSNSLVLSFSLLLFTKPSRLLLRFMNRANL